MAFIKRASVKAIPVEALYVPNSGGWEYFNTSRIKTASLDKTKKSDLGGFDLQAALKEHPNHLFVKAFAIKENEVNDNGDAFSPEELKKAAHTFIGCPVFVNHQNDDIEKARGKVAHAWYDEDAGGIFVINMVDKEAYPPLARGIEEGYIIGTSMGAQVGYSCCSICHNKAATQDEFCLTGETPILMSDFTTKPISDIQVGDEVIDAFGKPTFVTQLFRRSISEKILVLKSPAICGEIRSTKNHPFLVSCRGEYRYHPAEYLNDKQDLFTPVSRNEIKDVFAERGFSNLTDEDQSRLSWLLGLYAADGSAIRRDGRLKAIEISLHADEDNIASKIKSIAEDIFGVQAYDYRLGQKNLKKSRRVRIWSEKAANLIVGLCPGTVRKRTKKFDRSVFSLNDSAIRSLVCGFVEGDGTCDGSGRVSVCGAGRSLLEQMFYLFLRAGIRPWMNNYQNSGGPFNRDKTTVIYRLGFGASSSHALAGCGSDKVETSVALDYHTDTSDFTDDGLFAKHRVVVDEVDYHGEVFNIETESHSYVANNTSVHNCDHIKHRKNKKISRTVECAYHKSKSKPQDDCPVCGCKKGSTKENDFKEAQIFEWNYDIKFIEDSFVVNPACHDCLVCEVLNVPKISEKVSGSIENLKKCAAFIEDAVTNGKLTKTAGVKEINALNEAMNLLEGVARSMMAQKQMVSMEYVSDIVENLSKLQDTADELVQMGYGQLPSPPQVEAMFGNNLAASPLQPGAQQMQSPNAIQPQQPQMAAPNVGAPSSSTAGNGVATVTRPTFSSSSQSSQEEFLKVAANIHERIRKIHSGLGAVNRALTFRRTSVFNTENTHSASNGDLKIVVAKTDDGETHVAEFSGAQLLRLTNAAAFDNEMRTLLASNPEEAAKRLLTIRSGSKESGANMANDKIAAGQGVSQEQTEVITQKQLENHKTPLHPRQDAYYETTTEGDDQLGGKERVNHTTTESPQVRRGSYDVITQAQLDSIKDGYMTRFNDWPEVITEKQWDEMSRSVDAILPDDWTSEITQAQLLNLRDNHRWEDPEVITEGQLKDQKGTMPHGGDTARWKAAATDINALVKAATSAVADAIANYGLSPRDIANAVATMTISPQAQMKTAYLTLINAVPAKIAARSDERARRSYFAGRGANVTALKPIDGLLAAMADNIGYLKAENYVDAVRRVVSNKIAFAKAEADAMQKIASAQTADASIDLDSEFNKAFSSLGTHKVLGSVKDDLKVDPADERALVAAAYAFASAKVGGKTVLASLEIDDSTGAFEAVLKDVAACSAEEIAAFVSVQKDGFKSANLANFGEKMAPPFGKKEDEDEACDDGEMKKESKEARAARRERLIKEAQMMGGQMGGGAGGDPMGGGGQGATLPTPPDAGGAPVQSFDQGGEEGLMGEEEPDADLQPQPPGSYCPVCASDNVDIVAGKGKCGDCTSEFTFKVSIDVTKWAGLTGDDEEQGDELGGEGEGFALTEAGKGMEESLPVAASTRLKPEALKKMAAAGIKLGNVSPYTGTTRTAYLGLQDGANHFLCLSTGLTYQVRTAQKDKNIYAQWEWLDGVQEPCTSCKRVRKAFASAMAENGLTEEQFNSLNRRDRGRAILAMLNNNNVKLVKTAAKKESVLSEYKKTFASFTSENFPTEACREIIARKFGEDAIALSGPDEGQNLAESVCKRLAKAGLYSDRIAVKIASIWGQRDACLDCLEDHIRAGFRAEAAASICDGIKAKYAQAIEMLADELGDDDLGSDLSADPLGGDVGGGIGDELGEDLDPAADPFGQDAGNAGFVSVEIPLDVLEQLDQAFDTALGVDPASEPHHDAGALPEGEVEIQLPRDTVQELDQVVDPVLDGAAEIGQAVEDVGQQIDTEEPVAEPAGGESFEAPAEDVAPEGDTTEFEEEAVETPFEDNGGEGDDNGDDDGGDDNGGGEPPAEETSEEGDDDIFASAGKNLGQKKESSNVPSNGVRKESSGEATSMDIESLNALKRGKIAGTGKVTNLDLDAVAAAIGMKKKAGESGLTQKNVQDDKETKPYGGDGGSAMGHEEGFSADDPDVPSKGAGATMGEEPSELMPDDNLKIPAGGGTMGHEPEQGYTPEKGHEFTGGVGGAGSSKAASRAHQGKSTKAMTNGLVDRLVKIAEEKTLKAPAQLKDDSDIGTVSNNKDHSNTPEGMKIKPFAEGESPEVPEAGNGAFMGHEEESIGEVPKSPKHHPKFPAGGKNPKYDRNEKNNPEKQDHDKGTVIASSDEESLVARRKAAEKLAGKMIAKGIITADQISTKIAELSRYEIEQIADYEKSLFGVTAKKGLDTVAKGAQTPLVIHANKNSKNDPAVELKSKLQSLFSLDRLNGLAAEDPNAQIRRYR